MVRYFLRACLVVAFLAAALQGCTRGDGRSPQEMVSDAAAMRERGELKAAEIELKNLLQRHPDSIEARWLLGSVYLDGKMGAAAAKELRLAHQLGMSPEAVAIPLAKALLVGGEYDDVMSWTAEVQVSGAAARASLNAIAGKAHLYRGQAREAAERFDAALRLDPGNVEAHLGQGLLALRLGALDEAERWARKTQSLSATPEAEASAILGDVAVQRGSFELARPHFLEAVRLQPYEPAYRVALAMALIKLGEVEQAKMQLDGVLAQLPNQPAALYFRAVAALLLDEYEAAANLAEKALQLGGGVQPSSRLVAAAALYQLQQHERAKGHAQAVLAVAPTYKPALALGAAIDVQLGLLGEATVKAGSIAEPTERELALIKYVALSALQLGRPGEALALLERQARLPGGQTDMLGQIGVTKLGLGRTEDAIAEFEKRLDAAPDDQAARVFLIVGHLRAGQTEQALARAEEMQRLVPDNPDGYTLAGLALAAAGRLDEAMAMFRKAWEVRPGDPNAGLNLARISIGRGDATAGKEVLRAVLAAHPGNPAATLLLAQLALQDGDAARATEILESTLAGGSSDLSLRLALARISLLGGKAERAAELMETARQEFPGNAQILETLGFAQVALNRLEAAALTADEVVRLRPRDPAAYHARAVTQFSLGRIEKALQAADDSLRLAPRRYPSNLLKVRLLLAAGRLTEADTLAGELAADGAEDAELLHLRGKIALAQGRQSAGVQLLERAFARRENNLVLLDLVAAHFSQGETEHGLGRLSRWLDRYPQDALVLGANADVLLRMGRHAEARAYYQRVLAVDPDHAPAHNNLSLALVQLGEPTKALEHALRARDLAPGSAAVADTLGLALLHSGRIAEAIRTLRSASDMAPESRSIKLHLAEALAKDGQIAFSRRLLGELVALGGESAEVTAAAALLEELQGRP